MRNQHNLRQRVNFQSTATPFDSDTWYVVVKIASVVSWQCIRYAPSAIWVWSPRGTPNSTSTRDSSMARMTTSSLTFLTLMTNSPSLPISWVRWPSATLIVASNGLPANAGPMVSTLPWSCWPLEISISSLKRTQKRCSRCLRFRVFHIFVMLPMRISLLKLYLCQTAQADGQCPYAHGCFKRNLEMAACIRGPQEGTVVCVELKRQLELAMRDHVHTLLHHRMIRCP